MDERVNQGATLTDYVRVVWTRRWLIGLVTTSIVSFTVFFTLRSEPVFEAETTMLVEPQDSGAFTVFDPTGFMKQKILINNECELLRSRTLAQEVVNRALASGWRPPEDLEPDVNWATWLRKGLVVRPLKDADVIEIRVQAPEAEAAALFANLYAEAYRHQNVSQNRGELSEVRSFLEQQLGLVEERLGRSEGALRDFKAESGLVSLDDEVEWMVRQAAEFEGHRNSARTDVEGLSTHLAELESQLDHARANLVENIDRRMNKFVEELRLQVVALETERAALLVRGADPVSPQIFSLDSKISQARAHLVDESNKIVETELLPGDPMLYAEGLVQSVLELRTALKTAVAREASLQKVAGDYNRELQGLPDKELVLARLTRDYTVNENTYVMMKAKLEEVRISEAGEIGNVRIIDPAVEVWDPVKPNKKLNVLLGLLAGLGLGAAISFLLEYLDTTLRSIEDVEQKLDTVVLGAVPELEMANNAVGEGHRLVAYLAPKSPAAESYRTIRTNVGFAAVGAPLRTMGVTSSGPREGKSTTAANLAITLAQGGRRTVLLDADLRRPMLHHVFSVEREQGLTDYLVGNATLEEIIRPTAVDNLYVVAAGALPPNPSELLGAQVMEDFLEAVSAEFDQVVVDTPPIMAVTDALVLSAKLDGMLLVVEAGRTAEALVRRTRTLLGNASKRFLGAVLNNLEFSRAHGYYGYYRYYQEEDEALPRGRRTWKVAGGVALLVSGAVLAWRLVSSDVSLANTSDVLEPDGPVPSGVVAQYGETVHE